MHDLKKQKYPGFKSWNECVNCGAAKHSGFWFLAGKKAKNEPPCIDDKHGQEQWLLNAIFVPYED